MVRPRSFSSPCWDDISALDTLAPPAYHLRGSLQSQRMRRRFILLFTTLAIAAPPMIEAQSKKSTPVAPAAPRRDTLAVALISTDTIAAGQVDIVVRARHREVQFCFEESGLKTDPELTGTFAMLLTLDTAGTVSRVDPSWREWSGPDGTAVEACVMQRALSWKFPARLAATPARHEVIFQFSR